MVDSSGRRRRISERTVRPPTPESKTPIGRGSACRSTVSRSVPGERWGALLELGGKRGGDAPDPLADRRVGTRGDERDALVVGEENQPPVGDDLEVDRSA